MILLTVQLLWLQLRHRACCEQSSLLLGQVWCLRLYTLLCNLVIASPFRMHSQVRAGLQGQLEGHCGGCQGGLMGVSHALVFVK